MHRGEREEREEREERGISSTHLKDFKKIWSQK
jgi:hypothetical protein